MFNKRLRALTLVEMLCAFAIIIALAAIIFPIISGAKRGGKVDTEISQMHQIGLAANLYHEQNDAWPKSTQNLVSAGLIPKEVCKSPLDKFPSGASNAYLTEQGSMGMTSGLKNEAAFFPNTYLSIGDALLGRTRKFEREMNEEQNFGLFISLTDSKPGRSSEGYVFSPPYSGAYRRVLLDGSVVIRQHARYEGINKEGERIKFSTILTMWFDPSEQWIDQYAKTF